MKKLITHSMRPCIAISLERMSQQELQALIEAAQKQSAAAEKEHIVRVRKNIKELLQKEGLTLADVFGSARAGKRLSGPVAKYANPANATQTWTGHGKRPIWFKEALAKGMSKDAMLVGGTQK